jgi:hypothetical protein
MNTYSIFLNIPVIFVGGYLQTIKELRQKAIKELTEAGVEVLPGNDRSLVITFKAAPEGALRAEKCKCVNRLMKWEETDVESV